MRRQMILVLVALSFALPSFAQLNRTFVASTGNDANDCSRATPCRNFAAAVTATNAGGEVIALDSAGYGPTLSITKAISIVVPTGIYAGMTTTSGNTAISVNAAGVTVVLRGLYLNAVGGLYGIDVADVGSLYVENCVVAGFQGSGVRFTSSNGHLLMTDTTSRNNGVSLQTGAGVVVYGLDMDHRSYASIENCRLERNGSGFLINEDGGVVARGFSEVTVRHSVASGTGKGFVANATVHARLTVEGCAAANNVVGVFASDGDVRVRVSDTVITHNTLFGIEAQGAGAVTSRGNNTVVDNNAGEGFSSTFSPQ